MGDDGTGMQGMDDDGTDDGTDGDSVDGDGVDSDGVDCDGVDGDCSTIDDAKDRPGAKRHHMVSGALAPLYIVFGLKLGFSGQRQSPVE